MQFHHLLQLYNEVLIGLLNCVGSEYRDLEIRQTPSGDIFVRNAEQLVVNSADELLEALRYDFIMMRRGQYKIAPV